MKKKPGPHPTRDRIDRTANFYNYKPQSPNSRYHAGTDNL